MSDRIVPFACEHGDHRDQEVLREQLRPSDDDEHEANRKHQPTERERDEQVQARERSDHRPDDGHRRESADRDRTTADDRGDQDVEIAAVESFGAAVGGRSAISCGSCTRTSSFCGTQFINKR